LQRPQAPPSARPHHHQHHQVRLIRNARAEYGVEAARKIGAVAVAADPGLRDALQQEAAVLALLARLDPAQVRLRCCGGVRGAERRAVVWPCVGLWVGLWRGPLSCAAPCRVELKRSALRRAALGRA
jgi:hypothetical protein